ncbi:hypothetical protein PNU79_07195 [Turicibacter sanguinis]|uniref:hypothetical protein n=1 Tax=Turicibacter sanguinis TaxID=154288 RepID=UPI00232AA909|nr:hypothetical protein [Turicibacter sanguinis]MDB8541776.1 hypothetical protein [Turicibacter sanguinis]
MAKKQQSQALEVLSKFDEATLDSLLALLQGQQAQAVPTEAPQEQPKQEVAQPKAKVTKATLFQDRNRQVIVRSCVDGRVIYKSKRSGMTWKWLEKGAYEVLTVEELLNMESQSHKFLHSPWLMVDDEDIIEAFNLAELYDLVAKVEDIDSFINMSLDEQKQIYNKLPKASQNQVYNHICFKVDSGEIDSRAKIRELEDLVGRELEY